MNCPPEIVPLGVALLAGVLIGALMLLGWASLAVSSTADAEAARLVEEERRRRLHACGLMD